jgi:hypothetical protein
MLNPNSITQSLTPVRQSQEVALPLPPALAGAPTRDDWKNALDILHLPASFGSFLLFLLMLCVLAVSMGLHVMLSARMMDKRAELNDLRQQYAEIQRQNAELVWRINQDVALDTVYNQALQRGYEPMIQRNYILGDRLLVNRLDENATAALQP